MASVAVPRTSGYGDWARTVHLSAFTFQLLSGRREWALRRHRRFQSELHASTGAPTMPELEGRSRDRQRWAKSTWLETASVGLRTARPADP